jgi:predicted membrane-bound mannosyltransferase
MIYDLLTQIPDTWLTVGILLTLLALAALGWGST